VLGARSCYIKCGMSTGNLSIEAQARYGYIESLLVADFPPPARVVELGAAPGDQIARLADLGYEATSVDIGVASDAWGHAEEGRMDQLLAASGVRSVTWNLEEVPYPLEDSSYDIVMMTEVYEHLRDYPIRSLEEVWRILRPGGRLYFTTPNAAYLVNRVRCLAGRSISSSLPDWIGGIPHARHAREYTFSEVHELVETVGLRVVSSSSRHFYLDSGRTDLIGRSGKRALSELALRRPSFGPAIIVVAERPA
jgi:SAM-dependent methyltransferase